MAENKDEKYFWQNYSKVYHFLEFSKPYNDLLKTIGSLIDLENKQKWLDVGTGSGGIISLLHSVSKKLGKTISITGTDFEESMLAIARDRFKDYCDVSFLKYDLSQKSQFPDENFNGIVANLVLPYVTSFNDDKDDPVQKVLVEFNRILKSGGTLIWSTPIKKANFFVVFLNSLSTFLRYPSYFIYAMRILKYSRAIKIKSKLGTYNFLDEEDARRKSIKAGFSSVVVVRAFANQAIVVKCNK